MKKLLANILAAGAIMGTSVVAHADEPGWQHKATDEYKITGDTMYTHVKTLDGGGVKVCFYDVDHVYNVQMYEADSTSPDDKVGGPKTLYDKSGVTQCLIWDEVNEDVGQEELYLELSKGNTIDDNITIRWYD